MQFARLRQLQSAISDQQMKLLATQSRSRARTRSDLEGNLNSTRNELNGSIARTHEELLALGNRGLRDYFEFDAAKSKQFQAHWPGEPLCAPDRPSNSNVDLVLLVNDQEISKKGVNLYEPVGSMRPRLRSLSKWS